MTRSSKGNNGCLWLFVLSLLSIFSFVIIKVLFPFSSALSAIIAVFISLVFLKLVLGNKSFKSLIRSGIFVFIILFAVQFGFRFLLNILVGEQEKASFTKEEKISKTIKIEDHDTIVLFTSSRNWKDNYGNDFKGDLSVRESDYLRLKNHIKNFKAPANGYFWGSLYDYIDRTDIPSLDLVIEAFKEIHQENNLNQMEFAEMVVSCIHDIPYSFVFQNDCPTEDFDETTKSILENCSECCIGNVKYGIQNPVSFLKNLKGDCDTRTVLIYSILKYFNYDVAIANSEFYRHSIIGINLPASGYHKVHNGKKYFLWETTAKYFELGNLSPSFNDVTHWNIILTSK